MTSKKRKTTELKKMDAEENLSIDKEYVEIGYISFRFPITRDEAEMVVNKPKGIVARKLRKFMSSILETGAKKLLESKKGEDVVECSLAKTEEKEQENKDE